MNRLLQILVVSILLGTPYEPSMANPEALRIRADGDKSGNLLFEIENLGQQSVILRNWQLPWSLKFPFALTLSVHEFDPSRSAALPLEETAFLTSTDFAKVSIDPGKTIVDAVPLINRFPDTRDVGGGKAYYIHWTYVLRECSQQYIYLHFGIAKLSKSGLVVEYQESSEQKSETACPDDKSAE